MPPTARDALIAIAELLAPDVPDVADRVVGAHDDPLAYVQAHAEQLALRGIREPRPNLSWIALVDALDDHGLCAEVDWKEMWEGVIAPLRRLRSWPTQPDALAWADPANTEYDDLPTLEFLRLAGDRLRRAGTALAVVDIDSDCYPLVLVPVTRAKELIDLATIAGFGAYVFATSKS